jgi:CO/xanthine dehydrogenase FAD-binding subunit
MSDVEYHRPVTSDEVSTLLQHERAVPIAGATDLLIAMRCGRRHPSCIVDLNALPDLREMRVVEDGSLVIGATVRLSRISSDPLCKPYRALVEAAATVGSVQIRNRATLIGNVCNASPAADTAPALLVYDARLNIVSGRGRRDLPAEEFWRGPGEVALEPGEWVESITFPPPARHGGCYLKLGRTLGTDLAIVGVAAYVSEAEVRIGLASVAPTPIRPRSIEAALAACDDGVPPEVFEGIQRAIHPISDLRASDTYRRAMTAVLLKRAVVTARARLAEESEGFR